MSRETSLVDFDSEQSLAPARNPLNNRLKMRAFTAIVERCTDTGLYVGYVPGLRGAHTQAETLDELKGKLQEVVELVLSDGDPPMETEFVGTQTVLVA